MAVTTKEAARPPSPRGLKSRSSKMQFPAFGASKSVLFLLHLKISVVVVDVFALIFYSHQKDGSKEVLQAVADRRYLAFIETSVVKC